MKSAQNVRILAHSYLHVSAPLAPPPRAPATKHHEPAGLKQQKFILSHYSSGGRKSKIKESLGLRSL